MNVKLQPCSCGDLEFRYVLRRQASADLATTKKKKRLHCIEISKNAHIYNSTYLSIYYLDRSFL